MYVGMVMVTMKRIADVLVPALSWVRPRVLRREYHVVANRELVGTLRWPRRWSSLAIAESADGRWTFQRFGLFRCNVCVRVDGRSADAAVFLTGWWGNGVLDLGAGRRYRWRRAGLWHPWWVFTDARGVGVVRCRSRLTFSRTRGRIEVTPSVLPEPDIPLLVLLGVYRLIERARRAAARGAA